LSSTSQCTIVPIVPVISECSRVGSRKVAIIRPSAARQWLLPGNSGSSGEKVTSVFPAKLGNHKICNVIFKRSSASIQQHGSLTRSLPLTRPSRACRFAPIPFAASQAAQVENYDNSKSYHLKFGKRAEVEGCPSWSRSVKPLRSTIQMNQT
jgi:hypothetical protein